MRGSASRAVIRGLYAPQGRAPREFANALDGHLLGRSGAFSFDKARGEVIWRKEDVMKRALVIAVMCLFITLPGSGAMAADKIVLKKYPELKMGFLNVNFVKQWPLGVESAKKAIDFASQQGFWWIEIRDPYATLTLAESKELAVYAKQRDVEVAYAMNIGLLDPNFWEVFSRGLANAAVFDGPRTIRTAGPSTSRISSRSSG
jgi:hypothetical protein